MKLTSFFLICTLALRGADLACSPEKPVVKAGETIQLQAFATPGTEWKYSWSAKTGSVDGQGSRALWNFEGAASGLATAGVTVNAAGASSTCLLEVVVQPMVTTKGDRAAGRSLLASKAVEPAGYGLYSYVLMARPGDDEAAKARNKKTIEAVFAKLGPVADLEKTFPRTKLNLTLIPVTSSPKTPVTVDWILAHYDFDRALVLLQNADRMEIRGVQILSAETPLTRRGPRRLLYLDLSWAPAKTAGFWVAEFINQSSQQRFDQPRALPLLELRVRTAVSVFSEGIAAGLKGYTAVTAVIGIKDAK